MPELEIIKDHLIDMNPGAEEAGTGYMSPEAEQKQADAIAAAKAGHEAAVEKADEAFNAAEKAEKEAEERKEPEKEEVKAEVKPEKTDDEPTPPDTPVEYKRVITREKNRRKTVEDALAATQAQLNQALTALNRYIPDPNAIKPEPQKHSYPDDEQYIEARSEWIAEQKFRAMTAEQQRKVLEAEGKRLQDAFESKLKEAEDKLPGVTDLMGDPTFFPFFNNDMATAIKTGDDPAGVLHFLDENRTELERISKLNPARAAAEIGKIEAKLAIKPAPKVSNAPRPISPVRGGEGGIVRDKYDPQTTDEQYFAIVEQERKAKLAEMRGQSPK